MDRTGHLCLVLPWAVLKAYRPKQNTYVVIPQPADVGASQFTTPLPKSRTVFACFVCNTIIHTYYVLIRTKRNRNSRLPRGQRQGKTVQPVVFSIPTQDTANLCNRYMAIREKKVKVKSKATNVLEISSGCRVSQPFAWEDVQHKNGLSDPTVLSNCFSLSVYHHRNPLPTW